MIDKVIHIKLMVFNNNGFYGELKSMLISSRPESKAVTQTWIG